jgi:hypothetical protein
MFNSPATRGRARLTISHPIDGDYAVQDAFVQFLGKQRDFDDCCKRSGLKDGPDAAGLSAADRLSIWVYTSHFSAWYVQINSELWSGAPSAAVAGFTRILNNALKKLPNYQGLVFRGYESRNFTADLAKYTVGATITWPGFTSTTTDPNEAYDGNMLFTIYCRSGRILGDYADVPAEQEVTFVTDTKFRVLDVERRGSAVVIELLEVDTGSLT